MKKTRIFAVLAAMGLAVFGCKAEIETEYEDKVYAEAVTFTAEDAGGDAGVKVAMATKTEGAAIYYTTDGTEPTENSERYTEAVTFGKDTVVKAVAVKKGIENSPVSVAKVSIKTKTVEVDKVYAEAVTFTAENAGEAGVKVTMASKTEGASIYYTTDGTEPTENSERYTEAVTFSKDTVVKAIAVKAGIENSPISVAKVSIKTKTVEVEKTVEIEKIYAEAVTFTAEDAGDAGVKVAMSTATEEAAIYYTTDGTEPTENSERYTEAVTFGKDTEIKAFAVKEGIENSPISVAKVSIKTKTITEKVYVCAKCQKEYKTAQEAIDCYAKTLDTTAPADVTELAAAAKDSSVVLTWKDATDEDIFGYLVSWKAESTGRALVALEKDSLIAAKGQQGCVVTGLTNGTKYTFTVKIVDTSGNTSEGVTVNATPVVVDSKETMKIALSVPEAKSNTSVTVTVNVETAAEKIVDVVYKKDGSVNAATLLADADAKKAKQNSADNKQWTFEITAADETANGTYTVAALDSDGREEIAQITIDNFDFTPPARVTSIKGSYSSEDSSINLSWTNPADSDFDHVEIVYTTNNGTVDSEKSVVIAESSVNKTFSGIDGAKAYYTYYIASVDKLGNKSNKVKYNVSVNKTVSNVPEGFVEIPAVSIDGTEKWTPSSNVFVSGRKLEIASFYMSDHEVTRGEYKTLMGKDSSSVKAYDKDGNLLTGANVKNNPANFVNWYDAIVYCNTLSIKEGLSPCYTIDGKTDPSEWGGVPTSSADDNYENWNVAMCDFTANGYRLPAEIEWEWAARGGSESYEYAGSDDIDEVAWYGDNTNYTGTRDVKTKKANFYGLYDMSGNVLEWCWDWYGSISSVTPISGSDSGSKKKCLRGGSWTHTADGCSVVFRARDFPFYRGYGFRLVRNAN